MDALVQAAIALALILVLVLILYLADRLSSLEHETREVAKTLAAKTAPKGVFLGFSGKKLWEAISAGARQLPPGVEQDAWLDVRERYHGLLPKHIEAIFKEGTKDGRMGVTSDPQNPRTINLVRGQVESWLPSEQVGVIYKCGLESTQRPPEQWGELRVMLDEVAQFLFAKAGYELERPLSERLLPAALAPGEGGNQPLPETAAGGAAPSVTA